jgi:hypothetical protein
MLLGVTVGRCAVNAEANAVIGLGETLEEMKARPALPSVQIDLVPAANLNFLHAHTLNRRSLRPRRLQQVGHAFRRATMRIRAKD